MADTNKMTAADKGGVPEVNDQTPVIVPEVDVFENETGITLLVDMPGVSRDRMEVNVDGEGLSISGNMSIPVPDGMKPLYADVHAHRYQRNFTLSHELDMDSIDANLKNGVLTLRIPKREKHKPRKIEVRTA